MRWSRRALLTLAGSLAIAAPAMASDKLPPKPLQYDLPSSAADSPTSPSRSTPGDPSLEPIIDPMPSAPPPAVPVAREAPRDPAPVAAAPNASAGPDAYPFVLFFDWDSAELTPEAGDVLNNIADNYGRYGPGRVTVSGYADRSGSGDYNRDLSQRRVTVVTAYLARKNVQPASISTEAFGEAKPVIDTADGMREPQNRRVEITVIPGPGPVSAR